MATVSAKMKVKSPIEEVLHVVARLRGPGGCPWDRQQTHKSICRYVIEEVYELLDAVEAEDDEAIQEELGDLLLHVVFHCQIGNERGAFDFDDVCRKLVEKLVRRHPHVFGNLKVSGVDEVWANWEKIKRAEKAGTPHARESALDGIPKHLPALMRAEKLIKKARKAGLMAAPRARRRATKSEIAQRLFRLAELAQSRGWSAEELLRAEVARRQKALRKLEARKLRYRAQAPRTAA
ncbi:MAG: MazG family protein [Verrucomicrobiae bacterium]|nr:MazG family protein [Verrucomicrobiae bacterium]